MIDLDTASLEELLATQALLQRAHDYTEAYGFNIDYYEPRDQNFDLSDQGMACYIGTVRTQVGLGGTPDPEGPGHGDGSELILALLAMDRIARQELDTDAAVHITRAWPRDRRVGRYVEALGFEDDHEAPDALRIYRAALTDIYNRIEELESIVPA